MQLRIFHLGLVTGQITYLQCMMLELAK